MILPAPHEGPRIFTPPWTSFASVSESRPQALPQMSAGPAEFVQASAPSEGPNMSGIAHGLMGGYPSLNAYQRDLPPNQAVESVGIGQSGLGRNVSALRGKKRVRHTPNQSSRLEVASGILPPPSMLLDLALPTRTICPILLSTLLPPWPKEEGELFLFPPLAQAIRHPLCIVNMRLFGKMVRSNWLYFWNGSYCHYQKPGTLSMFIWTTCKGTSCID